MDESSPSRQVNFRLPEEVYQQVREEARLRGYLNPAEFMRATIIAAVGIKRPGVVDA